MGIFLALTAAFSLGIADFLAIFATKGIGTYRALLYMQLPGMVALTIYGIAFHLSLTPAGMSVWQAWTWMGVYIVLNLLATLACYRALEVGMASIVAPIVASYAAIAAIISVFTGEHLSLNHALGVGTTLLGVALAVTSLSQIFGRASHKKRGEGRNPKLRGVWIAIASALGFGCAFWVLGTYVTPLFGAVVPVWFIRLASPALLLLLAPLLRQGLQVPRGMIWCFLAGVGLFDTAGYIMATSALTLDHQLAIVGVLISLYSVVTVLLAALFLREHLQWNQWLGVGLIFIGIVLVNL